MRRLLGVWALLAALVALLVLGGTAAAHSSGIGSRDFPTGAKSADVSGGVEFGDVALGARISECPQAGIRDRSLRRTEPDAVERRSDRGTSRHTFRVDDGVLTHSAGLRLGSATDFTPLMISVCRRVDEDATVPA